MSSGRTWSSGSFGGTGGGAGEADKVAVLDARDRELVVPTGAVAE